MGLDVGAQWRVPTVAAPILRPHVHYRRLRAFRFQFQGGDEGVFTVDDDMTHLSLELESNGELHRLISVFGPQALEVSGETNIACFCRPRSGIVSQPQLSRTSAQSEEHFEARTMLARAALLTLINAARPEAGQVCHSLMLGEASPMKRLAISLSVVLLQVPSLLAAPPAFADGQSISTKAAEEDVSGADEFQRYCALCHGRDGRGLGPVSDAMTRPATDLTQIAKRNDGAFPFDKVAETIRHGGGIAEHTRSRMPAWGKIFSAGSDPARADSIVLEVTKYIQSLQEK
jgi:mono/diheme cytochrome c family protein